MARRFKYLLLLLTITFPSLVIADVGGGTGIQETTYTNLGELLNFIQSWLLGIAGGLALLFIIYGGFQYIVSGGNQQKLEAAKKTLTYAIIGLLAVVLAEATLMIVKGALSGIFGTGVHDL